MITTKTLTPGERLKIWRRREGYNQFQAAEHFGISRYEFRLWETDDPETSPQKVTLGKLTLGERASILRIRSNVSMNNQAAAMGCSAYWLRLMETGEAPTAQLQDFWGSKLT